MDSLPKAKSDRPAGAGGCCHSTVIKPRVAHIERCSECNGLSIHMGPATIRIDQSMLTELWLTLGEARQVLLEDGSLRMQATASA